MNHEPEESPVQDIVIDPDPVRLDKQQEVAIKVVTTGGLQADGRWYKPDGTTQSLSLEPAADNWESTWTFRPGDPSGVWVLEVEIGGTLAEEELVVIGPAPPDTVRFGNDFDVQPRQIAPNDDAVASGTLEIVKDGVVLPFGGQLVRIAFRASGSNVWGYIGEAVTEHDTGRFEAEIGIDANGEARAEVHFLDAVRVTEQTIDLRAEPEAPRADLVITGPRKTTHWAACRHRSYNCFLLVVRVTEIGGMDMLMSGQVSLSYWRDGGLYKAKSPGKCGRAAATVVNGVANVYSRRYKNVDQWVAYYS